MPRYAAVAAALLATGAVASCPSAGAATLYGPTPYLSLADSPFAAFGVVAENFEDGVLDIPGVTANGGIVVGGGTTIDSVDGDDGAIDGNGNAGRSFYSQQSLRVFEFTFDPAVISQLPKYAGLVWTDVGFSDQEFGTTLVRFSAFGPGNEPLGTLGPVLLGDGTQLGTTAEDRFFGVMNDAGVARIRLESESNDWEVDHVQYAVPEPASWLLAASGLAGLGFAGRGQGSRRR